LPLRQPSFENIELFLEQQLGLYRDCQTWEDNDTYRTEYIQYPLDTFLFEYTVNDRNLLLGPVCEQDNCGLWLLSIAASLILIWSVTAAETKYH
jgi:hypothetical protein